MTGRTASALRMSLFFKREGHTEFKDTLYKLIDDDDESRFFEYIRFHLTNTSRAYYKLIFFYGLGSSSVDQSLWIKLINSKRFSWMKSCVQNFYMHDLQPIMTCLSHNVPISTLNYAIEQKNVEAVECMLELQTSKNSKKIELPNLCHPMIKCMNNWNVGIAELLTRFGIDVNYANKTGNSALHIACKNSNLEAVEFLLEKRANVNARNCKGKTPLHIAVDARNEQIVKKLLAHGSLLKKDNFNHTPLFYAVLNDNKKTERPPVYGHRLSKRNLIDTTQTASIAKELSQRADLIISDVVSTLSINLVPLHDSDRYCDVIRCSMAAHVKHGIKPIMHSQAVRYPEARTVAQVVRIYDSPILQVLYSSVVWTSMHRTSINNNTMRSRLLLYITILLNSSSLEQCYLRHIKALLSFAFQCFIRPFPPQTNQSTNAYLTRILHQAWKEFTCLILLTQHSQMPIKQPYLEQLEGYLNTNIMPIFRTIEHRDQVIESLSLPLELVCIPIHLFLYLFWQTAHQPSEYYYFTCKRIKEYIDYFYPYYLSKHDMLTAIIPITCYDWHKLELNKPLRDFAGFDLGNFSMIENNNFDVKITDIIDFLLDMQIDTNFRSPITGDSSLHIAANEVMANELLHLLDVGTYPLTLDSTGNTFYQSIHDKKSFMEDEKSMILSHPSIEGLAPPKLETLCALAIARNPELCRHAIFDLFPNSRFSKLINLHLPFPI